MPQCERKMYLSLTGNVAALLSNTTGDMLASPLSAWSSPISQIRIGPSRSRQEPGNDHPARQHQDRGVCRKIARLGEPPAGGQRLPDVAAERPSSDAKPWPPASLR